MTDAAKPLVDVAYLNEPYWGPSQTDWVKSFLLFFDGIAVLVPDYMRDRPLVTDPVLAQPLDDLGVLHRLSPEDLIDGAAATDLADVIDQVVNAGAFDGLDANRPFAEISFSRLGGEVQRELAEIVVEQLRERGLASASEDGVSIPMHPQVRTFALGLLPQLIRPAAEKQGLALQPVTTRARYADSFTKLLDTRGMPTAGHVLASDLAHVVLDLSAVPLDEVLDFRRRHGDEYRAYARDLRRFVREIAPLDASLRDEAYRDRSEALSATAAHLQSLARTSWRKPLALAGLGIFGGAVSAATGNPYGAAASIATAVLGFKRTSDPGSAYTYLFQAARSLL